LRGANGFHPCAERQLQFPIDEIAHIHGPIWDVVLHIVEFVEECAAVGLRDARQPALVPDR